MRRWNVVKSFLAVSHQTLNVLIVVAMFLAVMWMVYKDVETDVQQRKTESDLRRKEHAEMMQSMVEAKDKILWTVLELKQECTKEKLPSSPLPESKRR